MGWESTLVASVDPLHNPPPPADHGRPPTVCGVNCNPGHSLSRPPESFPTHLAPPPPLHCGAGTYKLSDFGVSHFLASDADDALKNLSGTPLFAAPETCKGCGESYSGKAADIWALGITLYGLIYGQVHSHPSSA